MQQTGLPGEIFNNDTSRADVLTGTGRTNINNESIATQKCLTVPVAKSERIMLNAASTELNTYCNEENPHVWVASDHHHEGEEYEAKDENDLPDCQPKFGL
jgi:hypothetical protein